MLRILLVLFIYHPIKSTESLNLALVAKGFLVSLLYCSQVPLTACEYPNDEDGLLKGTTFKKFFSRWFS